MKTMLVQITTRSKHVVVANIFTLKERITSLERTLQSELSWLKEKVVALDGEGRRRDSMNLVLDYTPFRQV